MVLEDLALSVVSALIGPAIALGLFLLLSGG